MYRKYLKRIFDFLVSLAALTIVSPLFILIIIILSVASKENPFFTQLRPGKNEQIFRLLKFKSMNDLKDEKGRLLSDSLRLTPFGRFLRKTSLDELPQLINVLKGDMSLIGPRPLLIRYLPYYSEEERLRHSVRPGITGFAQVNGRNHLTWEKRLAADIYYVKNLSLKLDLLILYKTIINVFKGKDIILDQSGFIEDFDVFRMKCPLQKETIV